MIVPFLFLLTGWWCDQHCLFVLLLSHSIHICPVGYAPNSHLTAPWVKLLINFDSTRVPVYKSDRLHAERQTRWSTSARRGRPTSICPQSHHCKTKDNNGRIEHEWRIWWWRLPMEEAGRLLAPIRRSSCLPLISRCSAAWTEEEYLCGATRERENGALPLKPYHS